MENTRPYWKVIVSLAFSLLVTAAVIVGGLELIRFLMPFVIGWFVSCIANPVVCWLDKKLKIEKKLGSAIMIVVVLGAVMGLLYLVINLLVKEIGDLIAKGIKDRKTYFLIPEYLKRSIYYVTEPSSEEVET